MKHFITQQVNHLSTALEDKAARAAAVLKQQLEDRNAQASLERAAAFDRLAGIFQFDIRLVKSSAGDDSHIVFGAGKPDSITWFRAQIKEPAGAPVSARIIFEVVSGDGIN